MQKYTDFPKTKEEAQRRADELCENLKSTVGGDWITRVWFNTWFRYDAKLGTMSVDYSEHNQKFGCLLADKETTATFGAIVWTLGDRNNTFDTPKEAVDAAFKKSKEVIEDLINIVNTNEALISGKQTFKKVPNKLRVSHFPQVPCKPFTVEVADEYEAKKMVDTLAQQHLFLYKHKIIPDYSNIITVEMWDDNFDGEGNAGWCDYFNEEEGMDFDELEKTYLETK